MNCCCPCSRVFTLAVAIACLAAWGCGSSGPPLGQVKGKVVANGQPVTGGGVVFAPVGSKDATAARGTVGNDGSFTLTTNKPDDGAAIGKHEVVYNAPGVEQPEWDGYGTQPAVKLSPYNGMVPKSAQVEVKAGTNEITIELVPGPPLGAGR